MKALRTKIGMGALALLAGCAGPGPAPLLEPVVWTPASISTPAYETSPTFSPDGKEMYYVTADQGFRRWRILHAVCEQGGWSAPRPASFAAPEPTIEADPFLTPDGRRIYFVSARHDPENQDFDIYYADRGADGAWGPAVRLPAPVNSTASELLPRTDGEGRLYFGSARPGGFGQGDIYSAVEADPGQWRVENVGPPVSTAADEYEADISQDGRSLVVVADRGDRSHLYHFKREGQGWVEIGRLPGRPDVFQVGPLMSPRGEWLIFGQAHGETSGEMFLTPLTPNPAEPWPPTCG